MSGSWSVETADMSDGTKRLPSKYDYFCETNSSHLKLSKRILEEIGNYLSELSPLMEEQKSSQNFDQYKWYLQALLTIHRFAQPLYDDPVIRFRLPWLIADRINEIRLEMSDLKMFSTTDFMVLKCLPNGHINRLGWLYVVENLDLQSANWVPLVKPIGLKNDFGMRHLSRGKHQIKRWLSITKMFDNLSISEVEEERLFAGARSASSMVAKTFSLAFEANFSCVLTQASDEQLTIPSMNTRSNEIF